MKSYFFDSYALFEIINANPNYAGYLEATLITTRLNLMELHYGLLRQYGKKFAEAKYKSLLKYTVEVGDDTIMVANEFRAAHKKLNLSYIDCIGYITAKSTGVKFLTGDRQFNGMENVEYVK
ncbi:MAG: PIN domain-containing protein [archaeon]